MPVPADPAVNLRSPCTQHAPSWQFARRLMHVDLTSKGRAQCTMYCRMQGVAAVLHQHLAMSVAWELAELGGFLF
jgi:hypothetical protein